MELNAFLESLESNLQEQEKWIQKAIDKPGSLRRALDLKKGEEIEDVSDSKIKSLIQKDRKYEQKLIAYANMMGTQGKKSEKERILRIVRNTEAG